jgi:hypothetical protein
MLARLPRGLCFWVRAKGQIALQPFSDLIFHLDQLIEAYLAPLVLQVTKLALCSALASEDPLCDLFLEIKKAKIAKEYRNANAVNVLNELLPFGTIF